MGASTLGRVALMAIQPPFAQAILTGAKTVEFRKRPLADDVHTVLIYETAPTQRVVGLFRIADTVRMYPNLLWDRYGAVGAIPEEDFAEYFARHETGVGLLVECAVRFVRPLELSELQPSPAVPQSFSYVSADVLAQVLAAQPGHAALAEGLQFA